MLARRSPRTAMVSSCWLDYVHCVPGNISWRICICGTLILGTLILWSHRTLFASTFVGRMIPNSVGSRTLIGTSGIQSDVKYLACYLINGFHAIERLPQLRNTVSFHGGSSLVAILLTTGGDLPCKTSPLLLLNDLHILIMLRKFA